MLSGDDGSHLIDATLITPDDDEDSKRSDIVVDDEDMVHIFWSDERHYEGSPEIYYTKLDPSLDDQDGDPANESAITVIDDTRLTTADDESSCAPQAAFQCGYIHITWKDAYWEGDPPEDVFYMILGTDGNIEVPKKELTTGSTLYYTHSYADNVIPVAVDSYGKAHVAWCDDRSGYAEIWYTTYQGPICVVPEAPRAAARVSAPMGEAPHQVQFYDMSTGDIDSWFWSFGDGSFSDAQYPTHTYQNGGTYQVCLTVEGPEGSDTACIQVIVEEGAGAPNLVVRNLYISATQAQPRQQVMITADVFNEGTAWGDGDVDLFINGQYEQTTGVGVSAGTSQPISFTVYKVEAGEYQVTIGNATGTFYVVEEQQPSQVGGIPMDSGTLIALIVIGVFVIAALIVAIVVFKPS
ncbi:MAG TPA: PKD domain-containing protein [Dehalococcoidia bacterium]|nr:PKD domain-containing protein [Dehalococcoidia bacterium]